MSFDLVDEIKLFEKEWLENGLDKPEHPLMTKWYYRDCPLCLTPFSITRVSYSEKWRCRQCGRFFTVRTKSRNKVI